MNARALLSLAVLALSLGACIGGLGDADEPDESPAEVTDVTGEAEPARDAAAPEREGRGDDAEPAYPGTSDADEPAVSGEAYPGSSTAGDASAGSADMLSEREMAVARDLALGSRAAAPVTAAMDRDQAEAMALADLADRPTFRVLYTERYPEKGSARRQAEVALLRYDTGELVRQLVDLESGDVMALETPPGFQAPLARTEIDEATRVARGDNAVRRALEEAGLEPDLATANGLLTGSPHEPDTPCYDGRCVRLFFSTLEQPVPRFTVIVDLVALEVVSVEPMPREVAP